MVFTRVLVGLVAARCGIQTLCESCMNICTTVSIFPDLYLFCDDKACPNRECSGYGERESDVFVVHHDK
jgi:hypothetical protein